VPASGPMRMGLRKHRIAAGKNHLGERVAKRVSLMRSYYLSGCDSFNLNCER
jgi:hypothetical protein